MEESIIFNSPPILGIFAFAVFLLVFELRTHSTGYLIPVLSALVAMAGILYALISGAPLQEIALVLMIFLLINVTAYSKGGEKK